MHRSTSNSADAGITDISVRGQGEAHEAPVDGSRADCLVPLPENVTSMSAARRRWNGVRLDVISAHCQGRVLHSLCYEAETRVAALLEEVGSPCEPRVSERLACPAPYIPRHLYLAPAGMPVWGYSADMRFVKDAVLAFDLHAVGERLGQTLTREVDLTPRLRFADDRLWSLIKLLADVVDDEDPSTQLYGDGLTTAIVSRLVSRPAPSGRRLTGLAPWQLRRVTDYLEAHVSQRVQLARPHSSLTRS